MNDGMPTGDRLARIEAGVQRRIRARRQRRTAVLQGAAALLLVAGAGSALALGVHGSGTSSVSSGDLGTADRAGASGSGATVAVRCELDAGSDTGSARRVEVARGALPAAAVAACTAPASAPLGGRPAPRQEGATAGATPVGVLCTDVDGSLAVLTLRGTASATCVRAGMEPYSG